MGRVECVARRSRVALRAVQRKRLGGQRLCDVGELDIAAAYDGITATSASRMRFSR